MARSELERNLGSGVPRTNDQHGAFLNLRGLPVFLGVKLDDALVGSRANSGILG